MVKKTRRINEDLIDLSDTPLSVPEPALAIGVQYDHNLVDLSKFMAPQRMDPSLSSHDEVGTPQLVQNVELISNQPAIAELDAVPYQNPLTEDLLGLVELPTSQVDNMDEKELIGTLPSAVISNQPIFEFCQSSEARTGQQEVATEKPATLELVSPIAFHTGAVNVTETHEPSASTANLDQPIVSIHQSSIALTPGEINTDKTTPDDSPTSTAAPSIFSHSSSLTSATGSSLPGITEEDVQARISSSPTSSKVSSFNHKSILSPVRRMTFDSAQNPRTKSLPQANDALTYTDSDLLPKPQQTQSEDSVSLAPSQPQLPDLDKPDEQGLPWIVQAARDGDEQMVRKLLVSGADIKATHASTRRHALSEASLQGHQTIVDLLIDEGCPLEDPDTDGNTALHHASRTGLLNIAKSLITGGALINASGPQGQTPLHLAMQVPHQNVVMLLIQHRANVNARDASFQTPLHLGAIQGNAAMCKYLLNERAQLDSREAQSRTPLQLACEAGHHELVQMLLDHSNLNLNSMTFLTAFFAAVEYGHVRIAESFFSHGLKLKELKKDSYKPATLAAKSGCLAMVELMMQENCDIDARDENGWNALHFASYHGHYHVIDRLIASNVSTKATTSRKETPLLFAIKGSHFAVAERLLRSENGSNLVNAEDERCQQPVHHAVRAGSIEIFNLLMSNGGKVNVENCFGWRPIHIATAYGHLALVERLLQQGANIEEKLGSTSIKKDQTHKIVEEGHWAEARWPYQGSRPLHLACEYRHDQIASHLISKGAKMETTCSEGWQPLHHAAYFGSSALVEMLLGGGVNPHATTNEGRTAQGLQFCTSGVPILEEDKDRITRLLGEAMDKARKQKNFKVGLKRGSTVEEKNNIVRAATFSMSVISRPPLHRVSTAAQALDPSSTHVDLVPSPHRPRLNHLPHTAPLPLTDSALVLRSHNLLNPHLPVYQIEVETPATPTATGSNVKTPDTSALEALPEAQPNISNTDQPPPSSNAATTNITPAPTMEMQLLSQPEAKLKRRTTFGLAKVKPSGMDIGKLSLSGMGKPAFELGRQTFDLGKQTLQLGKQGIEVSKQGLEKSRQGLEAIQGLEMGKRGVGMGKTGLSKAKKFATKGTVGTKRRGMEDKEVDDNQDPGDRSKDGGRRAIEGGENELNDNDDDEHGRSDDAGSIFSLGEFADLGNDNS